MKKYWLVAIFSLLMASFAAAQTTSLRPYQVGDWKPLMKSAKGAPIAIHFWGVTCPACIKEMPQWGSFVKNNPNAKVVFIQVDDVSQDAIKKMLNKAGLEKANNYYVAGPFDERLRYEIDPTWHGETPTTMVIDSKGKVTRKTGMIDFKKLDKAISHS